MLNLRRRADIDIIIVHYHAAPMVRDAVAELRSDAQDSGLSIEIFIADNGSTPDERALLKSLNARCLDTKHDAGYAGGINFAFPFTRSPFVAIMNEDVMVLPGCLARLRSALQAGAAVAGPQFFWDYDHVFVLPCTEERTRKNELIKAAGKKNLAALNRARERWREHARRHWRATKPMATTSISGALLAFRRDTWDRVGPWDANYQMYFDENDWLFRVERAGLNSVYVPNAEAVHLHNPKLAGDPDRAQWSSESFLRFGNTYYGKRFMERLFKVGSRQPVFPPWKLVSAENVEIPIPGDAMYPVWIEFTPSPFGYPAAAARIVAPSDTWRFPAMAGLPFLSGTYYLQVVDDAGQEFGSYCFERGNAPAQPVPTTDFATV